MSIDYALADGCARITLADPERGNSVNPDSVAGLLAALRRADADGARVVVLASTGRFFSVGGDLGGFGGAEDMGGYIDDLADALHRCVSEIQRSRAIVVAAVQGMAAGAGFPLAAAADVVVAADTAKFTLGYTKIGLSVDGGTSLLVHSLGLHRTLRLALLNDVLTAAEARDAGLVARVVPAEGLAATVDELAATLAAGPAGALSAAKRLLRDAADAAPEARLRAEALAIRACAASPDGREGVTAFLEKRPPVFG